jgi:hypothetical protein
MSVQNTGGSQAGRLAADAAEAMQATTGTPAHGGADAPATDHGNSWSAARMAASGQMGGLAAMLRALDSAEAQSAAPAASASALVAGGKAAPSAKEQAQQLFAKFTSLATITRPDRGQLSSVEIGQLVDLAKEHGISKEELDAARSIAKSYEGTATETSAKTFLRRLEKAYAEQTGAKG